MGSILVGILIGILLIGIMFLYVVILDGNSIVTAAALFCLGILCAIGGIAIGIFEPVSGYGEPQIVSTTELVSLRDANVSKGTGNLFYVSVSGTDSYTYYVEVDSTYASDSQRAYKGNTISDSNVTIVEDDSRTDAELVTYVRYGKKSFWTFAVGAKQYEYVFYVPTGTIVRDVSLG